MFPQESHGEKNLNLLTFAKVMMTDQVSCFFRTHAVRNIIFLW